MLRAIPSMVAAALLCSIGPSGVAAQELEKREVVLWHSYSGAEKATFEEIVSAFNESQSETKVISLFIPYTAFADKLTSAIAVGKGPDLFVFAHDRIGDWAAQGLVEPLQHYLGAEDVERFSRPALDALTVPQGSRMLYGLPLAMKSVALVYDAARVPRPPATLDELVSEARRLTTDNEYGFVMDWAVTYNEAGFLHAFGGMTLDKKGHPALDVRGNVEALAWVRKLREEGLLPREVTGAMIESLFNQGKAAMIVTGPWFLRDIKPGVDFRVAPLPGGPAGLARPFLSVEGLILSSKSRHKEAAVQVMRYVASDESGRLRLEKAGQPVANKASWAGNTDPALEGFRRQAELAVPMPSAPAMRHVWRPMDAALTKAIAQGVEPEDALREAQQRAVADYEVSERVQPIEVEAKDAEKVLERVLWQREHPNQLLTDSRWEAAILQYRPGSAAPLGEWCSEKHRGFQQKPVCPMPRELANLADLAVAKEDRPVLHWNADKTEVTFAVAIPGDEGRVALVRGGAPVTQTRAWAYGIVLTLLGLSTLAFLYRRQLRPHLGAYAYVFPAVAAVLVLVFLPFGYGLSLAFYDVTPTRERFVGLQNFIDIILARGAGDPHSFYYTFGMTILWTGVNVCLHVVIGLFLALMLQDPKLRFRKAYRVLLIVPWAIPNYITALIWKAMFNAEYGLINRLFGLGAFAWFDTTVTAFLANLATNVWLGFPFMMVTALGALQSIPKELYEAADVDGAGRWYKFRHVTLPLLKPALFPAIILGAIWTFNLSFNVIYLVSGGAPDGATDTLVTQVFRYAFEQYRYGYAAAYATIIFGILLTYTVMTNRITKATEGAFE